MSDISKIVAEQPINNTSAICSTLPTGRYSKLIVRPNYPLDLVIENIENKYTNRFDDPSYYYGGFSDGGYYTGS
jgi:hypothetical protein